MTAVELKEVHTHYGHSHVLHGVSLFVGQDEVVCLLGRNGAGKTTTIRSIMGLTPPSKGEIIAFGQAIQTRPPYQIFKLGLRWIPQGRRVFPMLTVEENIKLALIAVKQADETAQIERIMDLFPVLRGKRRDRAGTLSGGQLQMVAFARALVGGPRLILMDEPTEGLAPLIIRNIAGAIRTIKEHGVTVLLAEQNLPMALEVADRHYIIDQGCIRFQGAGHELKENEAIKSTYLGVSRKKGHS